MPTSNFMPDVTVHIAFDSGFRTPAASRTWTDVSDYVELSDGISITVGRQDERSTADANQLTITLDNRDGRFTAGRSASPYYPNVLLDRPIRVTADPVDGSASVRFIGYINEWPVEWNGTDAYAKATITASSRLSRLGDQGEGELRSIIEETILADNPIAYYTLSEPEGSTLANDSSGNGRDPLRIATSPDNGLGIAQPPLVFGSATGPGTDDLTAVQFAAGEYLSGPQSVVATGNVTVEAFFLCASPPASDSYFLQVGDIVLGLDSSGFAKTVSGTGNIGNGSTNLADGRIHHMALADGPGAATFYVDGVSVDTVATTCSLLGNFLVGDEAILGGGSVAFTGVVAHAACYGSTLSAARIAAHADAGLTGFVSETTDERLERYAELAGVPVAEVAAEAGQTTMAHVDTTGQSAVDLMRAVERTEGGVLFDAPDNTLTMHARDHRYTAAAIYTLNMTEQEVEAEYRPQYDRTGLLNDVTAQNLDGTVQAHIIDTTSRDNYGRSKGSIETASENIDEPLNLASWTVYAYKDPKERAPQVPVDALAQVGKTPNCAAVMATELGDKITLSNRPTQAATSSTSYFVEGWTEVYGKESLVFTFNVSPTTPYDQVLVVDDAVRGVVDTNPVAL